MKEYEKVSGLKDITAVFGFILLFAVAVALSGCGATRGWRFEIGVSPVSNLENKAGLTEEGSYERKVR